MDPQQELFTALLVALRKKYPDCTYDGYLPPEGTPYPFIYVGDSQQIDQQNKMTIFGTVSQTVHVYSNTPRNRGTVSGMLLHIKETTRAIGQTKNFRWEVSDVNQQILPDNTTSEPLLHGVLELQFRFS